MSEAAENAAVYARRIMELEARLAEAIALIDEVDTLAVNNLTGCGTCSTIQSLTTRYLTAVLKREATADQPCPKCGYSLVTVGICNKCGWTAADQPTVCEACGGTGKAYLLYSRAERPCPMCAADKS